MIKTIVDGILNRRGYQIRKTPFPVSEPYVIEQSNERKSVDSEVVEAIFDFFSRIPPFYSNSLRSELKIGGAWEAEFRTKRTKQLNYLSEGNRSAYSGLLANMLRNELISGQWSISYFAKGLIGSDAPMQFVENMEKFRYITGLGADVLDDGEFGHKWGVRVDGRLLTLVDPYKGVNAFNVAAFLNAKFKNKATYIDLGSGIGSDAIKVEKMVSIPTRVILCDIPLNLTTAFAYISMNARGKKCTLIDSEDKLDKVLMSDFYESEFVFVPTVYIERLANICDRVDLMYNHGSFSEMDYDTIKFYLDVLLLDGPVKALFEINSNKQYKNTGDHLEVMSTLFPVPESFKLLHRSLSLNDSFGHRYLESLYVKVN